MYWKGYSWSLLGILTIIWAICIHRSTEHLFTLPNGLMTMLWIIGLLGLFGFAYRVELFSSSFWKFIFWVFMVRWIIVTWYCSFPEVWNPWNTGFFVVTQIVFLTMYSPLYLALYWTAYSYGGNPSTISEGRGDRVNAS